MFRTSSARHFASLRTSLIFSTGSEATRLVMVTSAQPLEGKTTTSCNLALALARRLPRAPHRRRHAAAQRAPHSGSSRTAPGLSQVLTGQATAGKRDLAPSRTPKLWVLTAGTPPPNPSELLGSERMSDAPSRGDRTAGSTGCSSTRRRFLPSPTPLSLRRSSRHCVRHRIGDDAPPARVPRPRDAHDQPCPSAWRRAEPGRSQRNSTITPAITATRAAAITPHQRPDLGTRAPRGSWARWSRGRCSRSGASTSGRECR